MSQDDLNQLILQMAQSSLQLTGAVTSLTSPQASFLCSAADADVNIGLSKSHSLLTVEIIDAGKIDREVYDDHRSGLPAALRDLRPIKPSGLISDTNDPDYGALDPRHAITYGAGHDDATTERADALTAWHRARGRDIRMLEK